jgi:predicted anti-sigma-YlaC factor YlaD
MMKCSEIRIKLSAYLDGEVTDQEKKTLSDHLDNCLDCRNELQALHSVRDGLQVIDNMEVPLYFFTRLKQRIVDQEEHMPFIERIRQFALPGFAVVLTLLALVLGNTMARTIYKGVAEPELTTETANVFGIEAFDDYPEGSVSSIYSELIAGGE